MTSKKYSRVSDTGLKMVVSRSIDLDTTIRLNGTTTSSDSANIFTSFNRRYVDTNFTPPGAATLSDKKYNKAGYYIDPLYENSLSTFYTVFGEEPVVQNVIVDSAGNYKFTAKNYESNLDSRLSMDVFGDAMFFASDPNILFSIDEGTDAIANFLSNDSRMIVSFAGTNREFTDIEPISVFQTEVTSIEIISQLSSTFSLSCSFDYPSDGLAFPDGGHPYRALMADTRGQQSALTNQEGFSRGLSSFGLLPKTELYSIDDGTADAIQYRNSSYSPRQVGGELLPATSDADLRAFHGQYWVSSRVVKKASIATPATSVNTSNANAFEYGIPNKPLAYGQKENKRSYSASQSGGIMSLNALSSNYSNFLFQIEPTADVLEYEIGLTAEIRIKNLNVNDLPNKMPNIKGEVIHDTNMVQDYRSVVMNATAHPESVNYPFTSSNFKPVSTLAESLKLLSGQLIFDDLLSNIELGLYTIQDLVYKDEYPYVRNVIGQSLIDAGLSADFSTQSDESLQPDINPNLLSSELAFYEDSRYISFDNNLGIIQVSKSDSYNPATISEAFTKNLSYSDPTTYDFDTYGLEYYAYMFGMINFSNVQSFDIVGYNARVKTTDILATATAYPQKTINKIRFASNTVDRKIFNTGENIKLSPGNEGAFGVKLLAASSVRSYIKFTALLRESFPRPSKSMVSRPERIYIGDPIRIYLCGSESQSSLAPRVKTYKVTNSLISESKIFDFVINTTSGPISLSKDLKLSNEEIQNLSYFNLNDSRLTSVLQVDSQGFSTIFNSLPKLRPEVLSIELFSNNQGSVINIKNIILHHLQEATFKHEYYNKNGHLAHSMHRDPISVLRVGTNEKPLMDPGFAQSNGDDISSFGYKVSKDTIGVLEQNDVANINVQVYNPMFGTPVIRDGDISNSIYNFNTALDVNYRNGRIPFLRQGLVFNEDITVRNARDTVNTQEFGYGIDKIVPINKINEDKFYKKTDVFGRARINGVPTKELPIYTDSGDIESILLDPYIEIFIPSNSPNRVDVGHDYPYEDTVSKIIDKGLLKLLEIEENSLISYQDNVPLGMMKVNQDDLGFSFRTIRADAQPLNLPRGEVAQINQSINPLIETVQIFNEDDLIANSMVYLDGTSRFSSFNSNSLLISFVDNNNIIYRLDFDNGQMSDGNNTNNLFHPKSSKVDSRFNGIYYYGTKNQLLQNFMFVGLKRNSLAKIKFENFIEKTITIENPRNLSNNLSIKAEPVQLVPLRNEINGINNRISPAAYTLSDIGVYNGLLGSNASAISLIRNNNGSISSFSGYYVSAFTELSEFIEKQRFLNFPMIASDFDAYYNHRFNNSFLTVFNYVKLVVSYEARWKWFGNNEKPSGFNIKNINYSLGPSDISFGTATVNESEIRQKTRKISFGLEVAEFGDFNIVSEVDATYPSVNKRVLPDNVILDEQKFNYLPSGLYTFVLHIQDMKIPENSKDGAQVNVFTPTSENGLSSNFYWNIPSTTINESIFIESPSVNRTESYISVSGLVRAPTFQTSNEPNAETRMNIKVSPEENFKIQKMSNAYAGAFVDGGTVNSLSCDKGMLFPDGKANFTGFNVEGNPLEVGPSGDYRQNYKTLRIDISITGSADWGSLQNILDLGVSFRPNTNIPKEYIVPSSADGVNADTYNLYGNESLLNIEIPKGEYPCFARIGSIGFYQSNFKVNETVNSITLRNSLPADPFDHLPNKRQNLVSAGQIATSDKGLSFNTYIRETNSIGVDYFSTEACMLGFHAVVAPGENPKELDIPLNPSDTDVIRKVNRSMIEMGQGINIINLAGIATNGDLPVITSISRVEE